MPRNLKRFYDNNHLHFLTFSCYRRLPLLNSDGRKETLLRILERIRRSYGFPVLGYVVMPEHVHLLIGTPLKGNPSLVLKVVKQESAKRFLRNRSKLPRLFADSALDHFWQKRFYDFNVFSERKRIEKLKYIHRNPVKRGLVLRPEEWKWSSYRYYMLDEKTTLTVTRYEELQVPEPKLLITRQTRS